MLFWFTITVIFTLTIWLDKALYFESGHENTHKNRDEKKRTLEYVRSVKTDQTAHLRSLIRVFAGRSTDNQGYSYYRSTVKTLLRLRVCAGWFESAIGAHVWKYIFSHSGSVSHMRSGKSKFSSCTRAVLSGQPLSIYRFKKTKINKEKWNQ